MPRDNNADDDAPEFDIGDRVEHDKHGRGTVDDAPEGVPLADGEVWVWFDDPVESHPDAPDGGRVVSTETIDRPFIYKKMSTVRDRYGIDWYIRHRDIGNGNQYAVIEPVGESSEKERTVWYDEDAMTAYLRGLLDAPISAAVAEAFGGDR